jgi:MscS family membrane protein
MPLSPAELARQLPLPVADVDLGDYLHKLQVGFTLEQTAWWAWLILLTAMFLGFVAGRLLSNLARRRAKYRESKGQLVAASIAAAFAGPLNLALITLGLWAGLTWLKMSPDVSYLVKVILRLLFLIALGTLAFNLADVVDAALRARSVGGRFDNQIIPLVRKTIRLFTVVVFVLFTADNVFGADISAWLAGFGIAGLAVSLAAQDTIRNFFGSVTIFVDRPFYVGERIEVIGIEGDVEDIGFRSTRIRRVDGQLVTVPNSKFTDSPVRNISRRPYLERSFTLHLPADTPTETVQRAVDTIRAALDEPDINFRFKPEDRPPRVCFEQINRDNLQLRITYWHHPAETWPFMEHAETVNLRLLDRLRAAGVRLV